MTAACPTTPHNARDSCDYWCGVSPPDTAAACGMLPTNADIRAAPNADIRVHDQATTRHQIGVPDTGRLG